jgi:hypothetical protein
MNELEQSKLKYDIVFYHMKTCGYCEMAKNVLDKEIKAGIIGEFEHIYAPSGVQAFPHFVNNKNGKTFTGCPRTKDELFLQLDYIEPLLKESYNTLTSHMFENVEPFTYDQCTKDNFCNRVERFEMESCPSYPVVERMETISTDVLYGHHKSGYSTLSECWVKQTNYTA